jgi:hypothetical protein
MGNNSGFAGRGFKGDDKFERWPNVALDLGAKRRLCRSARVRRRRPGQSRPAWRLRRRPQALRSCNVAKLLKQPVRPVV